MPTQTGAYFRGEINLESSVVSGATCGCDAAVGGQKCGIMTAAAQSDAAWLTFVQIILILVANSYLK